MLFLQALKAMVKIYTQTSMCLHIYLCVRQHQVHQAKQMAEQQGWRDIVEEKERFKPNKGGADVFD